MFCCLVSFLLTACLGNVIDCNLCLGSLDENTQLPLIITYLGFVDLALYWDTEVIRRTSAEYIKLSGCFLRRLIQ